MSQTLHKHTDLRVSYNFYISFTILSVLCVVLFLIKKYVTLNIVGQY